jgi:hypothetical protein
MFTHGSSVWKTRVLGRAVGHRTHGVLVLVLGLVMGALSLAGCDTDGGYVDDHTLNTGLIGTWDSGLGDGYTITATTLNYNGGGFGDFTSTIRYIYNFSETAGVIIVEYITADADWDGSPDPTYVGKFQGVYFSSLTANTVKLGSAYTVADYTQPVEVDTLAEAKQKFKPANISLYGGELSGAGTQTKQP